MRQRTSLNQVKGSTSARWQEATKLRTPRPRCRPSRCQRVSICCGRQLHRGSRAPWRCCRSPSLRARGSGAAPSSSSACSAPPASPDSSARLRPGSPISNHSTDPGWAGFRSAVRAAMAGVQLFRLPRTPQCSEPEDGCNGPEKTAKMFQPARCPFGQYFEDSRENCPKRHV